MGLARLIFIVVFVLPIVWYLFLQKFGTNTFKLQLEQVIETYCGVFNEIIIIRKEEDISIAKKNYLDRVMSGSKKKNIKVEKRDKNFFDCISQPDADILLIDENGLRGQYELSRDGVDLLLTELDILLLQKSYGNGTSE